MFKPLSAIVVMSLLVLLGAGTATGPQTLPVGTQVNVHLLTPLSSGTAVAGEEFPVEVTENVVVEHHVVIEKGARGVGRVVHVSKATGKSPGQISIEIMNVTAVDGATIHVHTYTRHEEQYEYGKAHTSTVVGTLLTGPLGLFSHNMVKGKDITLKPDQTLPAYTSATVAVEIP